MKNVPDVCVNCNLPTDQHSKAPATLGACMTPNATTHYVDAAGQRMIPAAPLVDAPLISVLRLTCVACMRPVPKKRLTMKAKYTCSVECLAALNAFLKEQRNNRRCIVCSHPASPAEREEFKLWRKSRGETQGRKSNRVKALENALARAVTLIRTLETSCVDEASYQRDMEEFENLLDARSGKGSTLAPSGLAPDEVQGET